MWEIENLRRASDEAHKEATFLRETVVGNELGDSRLPDFIALSGLFGNLCIPFREHDIEALAPHIYRVLIQQGEGRVVIFQNPLYNDSSAYVAEADLSDEAEIKTLIEESLFSGGFVIGTISGRFRWLGNFTDYGFMFTDATVMEAIFLAPAFTTYNVASRDFRIEQGGDMLLDPEIRRLDKLWAETR